MNKFLCFKGNFRKLLIYSLECGVEKLFCGVMDGLINSIIFEKWKFSLLIYICKFVNDIFYYENIY